MDAEFRKSVVTAGKNAMKKVIMPVLRGVRADPMRVKTAHQAMNAAIKIEHMGDVNERTTQSVVLRTARFLENDELRREYIAATNPDVRKYMGFQKTVQQRTKK